MKRWADYHIEDIKNYCLIQGDFGGAFCLQALHIKVLELSRHRNKDVLCQEYDILDDLAEMIFPECSNNMTDLILEIAGLVLMEPASEQYAKSCSQMAEHFCKVWNVQAETVLFILVLSKLTIEAVLDEEVLARYVKNVLDFIKIVYGYESKVYAQVYLHFLCENRFGEITACKDEFIERYGYFKKYLEGYDCYYVSRLFLCVLLFMEQDKQEYEYWVEELTDAVAANKSAGEYPDLVCQLAYARAIEYEKRNDSQTVVRILSEVIDPYILPSDIQNNMFHVRILLRAAGHCYALAQYETMMQFMQKGVSICEELGEQETELYYDIYNYARIKLLCDEKYMEAQEFYSKNCRQIERNLGKNCKNYIRYLNNLGLVYMKEGRINDALHCFDEANAVEGAEFDELKKDFISRNIRLLENILDDDNYFMINRYVKKYLSVSSFMAMSNMGLKIHWLETKLRADHFDFAEIDLPFKEMYRLYKEHKIPDQYRLTFEYCIVMYQWRKMQQQDALGSSCKIVKRLGDKIYTYQSHAVAITHMKLLVSSGDYVNARIFGEKLIDYRYNEILAKGMGDVTADLVSLRMCVSYYLNLIDKYCPVLYSDNAFCGQLLERIVHCKTVEKDIRSFIGKFDSKQENVSFKLYRFRDLHRKVNALAMRRDILKNENSNESERKIRELDEKMFQYTAELAELEAVLTKAIDLREEIKVFKVGDIFVPKEAVAIEFFGYLDLDFDWSEPDYNHFSIRYICLAVSSGMDQVAVSYAGNFNDNGYLLQEYYDYFYNGMAADAGEISEVKSSFADVILPVVEPYIKGHSTVYWGMDAEMHIIPVEWILGKKYNEIINIHTDSLKYIRADEGFDFTSVRSLIMGNPKYAVGTIRKEVADEYSELRCSEIECREVAGITGGRALMGEEANQRAFNENFNSDILHISTHGKIEYVEDFFLEKNRMKHFHILLSGYADWCAGRRAEEYGNGTITADDVSYTNMKNTKLAVIAACLSGFSNVDLLLGNVYCFRWALGIAGVHFTVTALWETDDVATSIFVVLFYRYLRTAQIGAAFRMAKNRLRSITREEIEGDKILKSLFGQYGDTTGYGEVCPFSGDQYWAAFTCYCS